MLSSIFFINILFKQTFNNYIKSKSIKFHSIISFYRQHFENTLKMQSMSSTFKKSSFQSLKVAKEQFTKEIKIRSKKMKKYKYLKEQIYNNHNIFQSLSNINHFSKTFTAQNIIWKKNYQLKESINILKEENSSLKARIWNVEKENRKMDRQIDSWGLKKTFTNNSQKPYIDTATAEKVLHDQDYSITSIKILIIELESQLERLTTIFQKDLMLNKNIKNIRNDMNHQLCTKKMQLYKLTFCNSQREKLYEQNSNQKEQQANNKHESDSENSPNEDNQRNIKRLNLVDGQLQVHQIREQKRDELINKNKQLQVLRKNLELKKRSKLALQEELSKINQEMRILSEVTRQKIQHLREQAHKLKTEDESYVNEEAKKLTNVRQKYVEFECKTQDKMGEFIKKKIQFNKQIKKYQKKLAKQESLNKKLSTHQAGPMLVEMEQ